MWNCILICAFLSCGVKLYPIAVAVLPCNGVQGGISSGHQGSSDSTCAFGEGILGSFGIEIRPNLALPMGWWSCGCSEMSLGIRKPQDLSSSWGNWRKR